MKLKYENPTLCNEQSVEIDGVEYTNDPNETRIVIGDLESAKRWADLTFRSDFAEGITEVEEM
jgi:hypothetical protein